jgi:hypothetical protein
MKDDIIIDDFLKPLRELAEEIEKDNEQADKDNEQTQKG